MKNKLYMNKKGFTTVELVLTIALVAILLTTITSVTLVYQEKSVDEQFESEILTFKNTITKVIYDEILDKDNPVVSITGSDAIYTFTRKDGTTAILTANSSGITFDGISYNILESTNVNKDNIVYYNSNLSLENDIYILEIIYTNKYNGENFTIKVVVS